MDILCFKCEKNADKRLLSALCVGNEGANDVQNPNMNVQNTNIDVQNPNMDVQNPNTNNNKQHKNKNTQYCGCDDLEERIVEGLSLKFLSYEGILDWIVGLDGLYVDDVLKMLRWRRLRLRMEIGYAILLLKQNAVANTKAVATLKE